MKRHGPIVMRPPESFTHLTRARRLGLAVTMLLATAMVAQSAESARKPAKSAPAEKKKGGLSALLAPPGTQKGGAEIFADKMEMDFNARVARFEGHVRVIDPRMTLTADTLIAYFDENNRLTRVEALENVVIAQPEEGRKALAGHAVYDMEKGTIELTENPSLQTGQNVLYGAEKITYFRNSDRVLCEGGSPRIRIQTNAPSSKMPGLLKKLDKHAGGDEKK